MSLYYDAESVLQSRPGQASGSLKSRVFSSTSLKSSPKQVYALVSEASKWSPILKEVAEKSQLLQLERKLSPSLALLLVHDLLLAKRGIAAPASHPLRLAVTKHKARLNAELTKARLKRGVTSIEDLRKLVDNGNISAGPQLRDVDSEKEKLEQTNGIEKWAHPRWVRINTLRTSLNEQLQSTFTDYKAADSVGQLLSDSSSSRAGKLLHIDKHIPNLIALSPHAEISNKPAYQSGLIIIQDKASCFPAYLLDPKPNEGDCLDACAAPGNKTTHLAAILHGQSIPSPAPRIWACERDKIRAMTLQKMVDVSGAKKMVTVKAGQDFLRLDPNKSPWNSIGCLLLDPSCSGSGIVGREESMPTIILPSKQIDPSPSHHSKKRKRKAPSTEAPPATSAIEEEETLSETKEETTNLSSRLTALSTFQLKLLTHALSFPNARKITYSTCSLSAEENEHVVLKALLSPIAKQRKWRILKREEQVSGMRNWPIRGDLDACRDVSYRSGLRVEEVAEGCIRCEKGTREGTQGFFVAGVVRNIGQGDGDEDEGDWEGFSDDG